MNACKILHSPPLILTRKRMRNKMKTSDIKPNTLIAFNYKKTHPKEDRLFYVTKVEANCIVGNEFSDIGAPIKKFLLAHIINLALVPSAKLPIEAEDYAPEIFENMLQEDEDTIKVQKVHGELIGYVPPASIKITGAVDSYSDSITLRYKGKSLRLFLDDINVKDASAPNKVLRSPQELAQYILTKLS